VLSIGVSLLLLIYVVNDLYGYFIGVVIAEGVVATILFYWFLKNYSVILSRVSGNLAINLIKFGLPLLITEISFLLLTYADRYMIVGYIGKDALGLYSVGYNIASYISDALMFSLSYSIVPIYVTLYGEKGREETEVFLKSSMHYLLVFLIPICVGFTSVSNDLLVLLASEKYAHAATFSPIILIGSFFLGVNRILNAGLYLKKRTNILLAIMLTAVVINIILNVILLPIYGVTGAAIATLVACAWTTILTVVFSYKHLTIRINARLLFYHVVLSGIMFFVIEQIALSVLWIDLVVRIVTGMLIIGLGVVLIEKEIRAKIKTMLSFKKSLYETD
jgi:O-antigen/teichoic acid export membrane protein